METKLDSVEESIKQLREDMNAQFNRLNNVMLCIFSGFIVLVGAIIGFALWDRRTMIRPFETKVREIEKISQKTAPSSIPSLTPSAP